jgi:cell division protease FtsH
MRRGGGGPPWRKYLIGGAAVLLAATLLSFFGPDGRVHLSYSAFKTQIEAGRVAEITLEGEHIRGRFIDADAAEALPEAAGDTGAFEPGRRFTATMPQIDDPALLPLLESQAVEIAAEPAGGGILAPLLLSVLPLLLILGAFLYISLRLQKRMTGDGSPGGMLGFGKSRAKRFREEDTAVGFDDVAGLENAKADLQEIIAHLAEPARFRAQAQAQAQAQGARRRLHRRPLAPR